MKKVVVEVTKNCIRRGSRSNPNYCPIALAVTKYLNKNYRPSISSAGSIAIQPTIWNSNQNENNIELPKNLTRARFIGKFDNEDNPKTSIKPFSFVIKLPKEVLKPQYK